MNETQAHWILYIIHLITYKAHWTIEIHLTVINETECLPWSSLRLLRIIRIKWDSEKNKTENTVCALALAHTITTPKKTRSYAFCVLFVVVVVVVVVFCQFLALTVASVISVCWYAYLKFSAFSVHHFAFFPRARIKRKLMEWNRTKKKEQMKKNGNK